MHIIMEITDIVSKVKDAATCIHVQIVRYRVHILLLAVMLLRGYRNQLLYIYEDWLRIVILYKYTRIYVYITLSKYNYSVKFMHETIANNLDDNQP